jgi:biopolymer transport protein ExbD
MAMHRPAAEVSTSSMADIAFLLLTFFLITTVIETHKGIPMLLPQMTIDTPPIPRNARNLFTIQINSLNQFLIEGEPKENLGGVKERIKKFVLNNDMDPSFSESPKHAIVSLKTDRGTSYESFVTALDEIHAAYLEMYAERAGMSTKEFRNLDLTIPQNKIIHDKAKEGIPMNISMAEPTKVSQ